MRCTINAERIHSLLQPLLSQGTVAEDGGPTYVRIEADSVVEPPGLSVSVGEGGLHLLRGFTPDAYIVEPGFIFVPLAQLCGLLSHVATLDGRQSVVFAVSTVTPLLLQIEWESGHAMLCGLDTAPRGWKGLPTEEFRAEHSVTFPAPPFLATALGQILHVLTEEPFSRYCLNDIQLSWTGGNGQAVATDGHRLGIAEIEAAMDDTGTLLLSRGAVTAIVAIQETTLALKGRFVAYPVLIDYSEVAMRIIYGEYMIYAPLSTGRFPGWKAVVPNDLAYSGAVSVDRSALLTAIQGVTSIQGERSPVLVSLDFKPNIVTVIGGNAYEEESRAYQRLDAFDASADFNSKVVFFNAEYVTDLLEAISELSRSGEDNGRIRISFQAERGPSRFEASGVTYVVMPMQKPKGF